MYESRCGICCNTCDGRESAQCSGCLNMPKPFWGGDCPVKSCCEKREHLHCGVCPEYPCKELVSMGMEDGYDPRPRIDQLKKWADEM